MALAGDINEAQTEDDVIVPVLKALGWVDYTRQQTANRTGREDVPDFLLFPSDEAKHKAMAERRPDRRAGPPKLIPGFAAPRSAAIPGRSPASSPTTPAMAPARLRPLPKRRHPLAGHRAAPARAARRGRPATRIVPLS